MSKPDITKYRTALSKLYDLILLEKKNYLIIIEYYKYYLLTPLKNILIQNRHIRSLIISA